MADLHDTYHLTITTLSPLHIGTGNTLRQGYDFVVHKDKTWVIDAEVLASALYDQDPSDFDRMVQGVPAEDLLRDSDYDPDSPLFRYVMNGTPRSVKQGAEVQELLKDPWDRPYIPGSSLKGALRTALAYAIWEQRKLRFRVSDLNERGGARFAAQPLEHKVLNAEQPPCGKEPNHDLLRALQVGDSTPDEQGRVQLLNVQVAVGEKAASPIELEAVPREVTFTATVTLDGYLRQNGTAGQLGWKDDQLRLFNNLPQVVNHFSKRRLADEIERWRDRNVPIRGFFGTLARHVDQLDPRAEFLLQLGWGGGWDSKTLNHHLTADEGAFFEVVQRYGLDRQRKFQLGDHFPKSRRVVVNANSQPVRPLGWIKVRMERV